MSNTTTINGRQYTVEVEARDLPATKADLIRRGFDGNVYYLTGVRGSLKIAYRSARTGAFKIVG